VHGNHLGVPLIATDASGATATTPNDYLAPGYPGQSRVIADLYYNRYRDYDPTTGRYIQADPIGLGGGQNNYAYAANNPIGEADPMGLLGHGAGRRRALPKPLGDCPEQRKPLQKPPLRRRLFFCGEAGLIFGGGLCITGDPRLIVSVNGGALDGPAGSLGYAPNGAAQFLTGPGLTGAVFVGVGVTPSGDTAYVVSTGVGASVSNGVDVGNAISNALNNISRGFYDMLGRPYEQRVGR
jgi:RHS repeat-associated protein